MDQLVFSDKKEALQLAKKIKGTRFKVFKTEAEAYQFTKLTTETPVKSPRKPPDEV